MKNNTSMLQAVKKHKRSSLIAFSIGIGVLFIFLFLGGNWYANKNKKVVEAEYGETIKKTLKISVEEDGEIKNPQAFDLAFLTGGRIENILVEEGQKIKTGDKLAILDLKLLELEVQKSKANIQHFYGLIAQKKSENTNLDFLQSQEELSSRQSDIENQQKTTNQKVTESFDLSIVQIETSLYRITKTLNVIDSIFGFNNSRIVLIRSAFHDSIRYNQIKNDFEEITRNLTIYEQRWRSNTKYEDKDISQNLLKITEFAEITAQILDGTIYLFANSTASSSVSQQELNTFETQLNQEKEFLHIEIQKLVTVKKNIENALINQQVQMSSALNQERQTIVKTNNAEKMAEQQEISKNAGLSILYAQLAQAKANLGTVRYNLSLATLIAPADGEILNIKKEIGEIAGQGEPFIKILSDDNFIVEIYVEELDIVKIKIGQNANIRIAALNDQILKGIVSYISSNATEDVNGVITYLIRLEILDNGEYFPIKEKMSASVEFIIDEAKDAIIVPVEAIFQDTTGQSVVLLSDLTERIVKTGLSDNIFVEIKEGFNTAGIKIIKNPAAFIKLIQKKEEPEFKAFLPEIKKELTSLGFSEKEIKKIELGQMNEELKTRLQKAQKAEKGGLSNMMKN